MKVFVHTGPGKYVGSVVVALAHDEKQGKSIIRDTLAANGLKGEKLDIEVKELVPGVVYFDDGDD